jgi:sorting nexin-29
LDTQKLKTEEFRQKYLVEVQNRFECLNTLVDPDTFWQTYKNNILEVATETVGRKMYSKKPWLSQEALRIIEQRRKARLAGDMPSYRRLNGVRNKLIHRDKQQFVDKKADELEDAARKGDTMSLFKHVRDLSEEKPPKIGAVKSTSGVMLEDETAQLDRWKEHFTKLLNADRVDVDPDLVASAEQTTSENLPEPEPPSVEEIQNALRRMKNNKAPGTCGITVELLKFAGPTMLLWLHMLFSLVWTTELIPQEWKEGIILPLWKRKGSRSDCSNYRGITLLSVPGKLFAMTLIDRSTQFIRKCRRIQQAGFMPNRSTTEQIFTVRQVIEKAREFQRTAYLAFVDFKAAFDSVDRESLWLILERTGLPDKYCRLFKALYTGTKSSVQVNGRRSSLFEINTGVRQGCAAAPELFNAVIDYVMDRTTNRLPFGLRYGDRVLADCDFADDIALICTSAAELEEALNTLSEEALKVGLHISWQKTKIMIVDSAGNTANSPAFNVSGHTVEVVKSFTYLGSVITENGSVETEVQSRIGKAASIMARLCRSVWSKPNISRKTKMRIYNTTVTQVLLYGAETWPAAASARDAIDVAQTKFLRRIEGIRWDDFVSNTRLLALTDQTPNSRQVAARTLRWFGHLVRMPAETPASTLFNFDPPAHGWKRPRGRPRFRWRDSLTQYLSMIGTDIQEAVTLAQDRSEWRRRVTCLSTLDHQQET